ncbi:bifunctional hydroxymethylpyrimidine kinase/phosphomethylpyrimidine kinase [Streptococcus sp. NLN76]|uniref:bifunctional hydroxymethylpyrimidine kinase/phosphomethylpyrimidine kinase n=1 Tax=Streptococcus sp. NLN76 TaxID=2822800 RepID=UPI0018AC4C1C|nr:bifunctional hydroxymethylpyrimidine kinase/phosphomethylpyrimidine kinase [Streptococcus sp. NLN76]MBF8970731.1 bifunctional hydroxymethylpyrimidine kinase/phosphomethylpyrimidine kinase [Streptococcus sp. NLN76]
MTKILTIAGSDIFSGGGLQADLATITQLGAKGFAAVTCVTAIVEDEFQVQPLTPLQLEQQLTSLGGVSFEAIKIGLLPSPEHADVVYHWLKNRAQVPIVFDPVLVLKEKKDQVLGQWASIFQKIAALSQVMTPNLREAELLLGRDLIDQADLQAGAEELARQFGTAVYLKAGSRLPGAVALDFVWTGESGFYLEAPQAQGTMNGSGCVLASSLATYLGLGQDMVQASHLAKQFVTAAIAAADEWGVSPYAVN